MIYPIFLSGGQGARLWPISNENSPKQFLRFIAGESSITKLIKIIKEVPNLQPPIFVIREGQEALLLQEIRLSGIMNYQIIIEPYVKGTAAAIYSALLFLRKQHADAKAFILPSDLILNNYSALTQAITEYDGANLTLFGIEPTHPETGYGYLELAINDDQECIVKSFQEKPDSAAALRYIHAGFYWNSGMALCSASTGIALAEEFDKETITKVAASLTNAKQLANRVYLDKDYYADIKENSFDYAVLEKASGIKAIKLDISWQDFGSWSTLYTSNEKDENGNVLSGNIITLDTKNSQIVCYGEEHRTVAVIGLEGVTVVHTKDSTLVMPSNKAQAVKDIVRKIYESKEGANTNTYKCSNN
jgi:mannose-1-phosphate guanylyltransferase / mannose-6-phosphate isomerase